MHSPVRSMRTYNYISIYSYVFPKTNKVYIQYMEMKIFESSFSPYEDLQILGMLFNSHMTPHTTLGMCGA
jgi:hypothetical protein